MFPKVSVIIPSYNRFKYLLRAVDSIKEQTYIKKGGEIEVVIVNDKSSQQEYYKDDIPSSYGCIIKIIHLEKNSREVIGYPCAGYVRNMGVNVSTGEFVSFLDDDDWWTNDKVEKQIFSMLNSNILFSSTEGYAYDKGKIQLYNKGIYWEILKNKLNLDDSFPSVWNLEFLRIHNTVITSSVMMHINLWNKVGGMKLVKNGEEDYDCWLRCLEHTNCLYLSDPLFYYDFGHGDGSNY